jgi:RNA polymerase sigma-70 factor (ECF subfamily)
MTLSSAGGTKVDSNPVLAGQALSDELVVQRVLAGDTAMFEILMRRYNQRLYRVARSVLKDDDEAEDVMQDAYFRAYEHLRQFEGRATFSTWLTRIALHEALARKKRRGRYDELDAIEESKGDSNMIFESGKPDPEEDMAQSELRGLLENAIEGLPETFRTVVVLREIEEMSVAETAATLGLSEALVKTRLHRAHAMLRRELHARARGSLTDLYAFHAVRCDRVVKAVFERIERQASARSFEGAGQKVE